MFRTTVLYLLAYVITLAGASQQLNAQVIFDGLPLDTVVNCNSIPAPPAVTAVDTDGISLPVVFTENYFPGCPANLFRGWSTTDLLGNMYAHLQTIILQDFDAPVISGIPADTTITCSDSVPEPAIPVITDCDSDVVVTFVETETSTGLLRTWIASDICGNADTATQEITIYLKNPPVISGIPNDTAVFCPNLPPGGISVTGMDGAGNNLSIDFGQYSNAPLCPLVIVKKWTITDACNFSVSDSQIITALDEIAPVLIAVPMDTVLSCIEAIPAPAVTVEDNCDNSIDIIFQEDTTATGFLRTWTAADACGNTVSDTQSITILPCVPPLTDNDNAEACYAERIIINLFANDITGDLLIDSASVLITVSPLNGILEVFTDGTVAYTPDSLFSGLDNFSYTVSDIAGNLSNESDVTVNVNSKINLVGLITDAGCSATVGFIEMTITGGSPPYQYLWSDSATSKNQIAVPIGIYSLTVTDSWDCTDTATYEIGGEGPTITSVSAVDATGCDQKDGKFIIKVDGETSSPPYDLVLNSSFVFNGFLTDSIVITDIPPGAILNSVTIFDSAGCIAATSGIYKVEKPEFEISSFTPIEADCETGLGGVIVDILEPALPPYLAKIDDIIYGPFDSIPFQIDLPVGEYSNLAVRNTTKCKDTKSISLEIDDPVGCGGCPVPDNLTKMVFSESLVMLMWDTIAGGTGEYTLDYRVVGSSVYESFIVTGNSYLVDSLLECTPYEWRMRGICPGDTSNYTDLEFFSTLCPRFADISLFRTQINPNPSSGVVAVNIETELPGPIRFELFDLTGKLVISRDDILNTFRLDLSGLPAGVYSVRWTLDEQAMHYDRLVLTDR